MKTSKVFLGGTCVAPDWRPTVIQGLTCEYFNPVVQDWNEEARSREKQEKNDCGISLFVITPFMSGVFSIAEIVEDSITRRNGRTVLCVLDGWGGKNFAPGEKRSLDAVVDLVRGYGCHVVADLQQVVGIVNSLSTQNPSEVYLLKNKWLSLKKLYGPTGEYVFSHEDRCAGRIVAVLPYVPDSAHQETTVIAREEFTPPWSIEALQLSCITGGVDDGEDPVVSAARELREETGMDVPVELFEDLGTVRGAKSSDSMYYLFAVDVTKYLNQYQEETGEDDNERRARNVTIVPSQENMMIRDTILHSLLYRWEKRPVAPQNPMDSFQW